MHPFLRYERTTKEPYRGSITSLSLFLSLSLIFFLFLTLLFPRFFHIFTTHHIPPRLFLSPCLLPPHFLCITPFLSPSFSLLPLWSSHFPSITPLRLSSLLPPSLHPSSYPSSHPAIHPSSHPSSPPLVPGFFWLPFLPFCAAADQPFCPFKHSIPRPRPVMARSSGVRE